MAVNRRVCKPELSQRGSVCALLLGHISGETERLRNRTTDVVVCAGRDRGLVASVAT